MAKINTFITIISPPNIVKVHRAGRNEEHEDEDKLK